MSGTKIEKTYFVHLCTHENTEKRIWVKDFKISSERGQNKRIYKTVFYRLLIAKTMEFVRLYRF